MFKTLSTIALASSRVYIGRGSYGSSRTVSRLSPVQPRDSPRIIQRTREPRALARQRVVDHVRPRKEAVDDRPEQRMVGIPRDGDGQRGHDADAGLGDLNRA